MTPNIQTPKSPGSPSWTWRALSLPLGAIFALAAGTSIAAAQATDDTDDLSAVSDDVYVLEAFTVTGIQQSMAATVDIKRENYQIVDALVAEDIGKFPDNNLVEALQRIPGVQVTDRDGGEVSAVSIRGLNDVTTTLNGRNIFTSTGRAVALQDIPATLVNRVDVFKSRDASQIETGIAGVIDIRTHRPLNFDGTRISVATRATYMELADEWDPNLSVLASTTWDTDYGKFGALINLSYSKTHYRNMSATAGAMLPFMGANPPEGWVPYERIPVTDGRVAENPIWNSGMDYGLPDEPGSTLTINGEEVPYLLSRDAVFQSDLLGERERPAVNVSLQWAPNSRSTYTFESFYTGYRNETFNSLLFSFVDWWGGLGENPASTIELYEGTNIVKSRSFIGAPYQFTSGDLTVSKTDSYLYALGGDWRIGDKLHVTSDLSYQESKFTTDFFAMRAERVTYGVWADFSYEGSGMLAWGNLDNPETGNVDESDATDPSQWTAAQLYDNGNKDEGSAWTWQTDAEYDLNWSILEKVSFGGRYDSREAIAAQRTADAGILGVPLASLDEGLQFVNSDFFDGNSDVPRSWVVPNGYYINDHADEIRQLYNERLNAGLATGDDVQVVNNFNVQEDTINLYAMSTYATRLFGRQLSGDFGFRYVDVATDMTFTDVNDPAYPTSSASASTSTVLPSLTVRYEITDTLMARFAYGETLRRPAFGDLNPIIYYVEDVTNIGYGTATGGNPNLEPVESKNYDLSLEWYFAEASTLYVTAFKRDLTNLIVSYRSRVMFEDYPYVLSSPGNASKGTLEGFEFGMILFPDWMKGFGIQASATMLDSSQTNPQTNAAGEVVGYEETEMFGVSDFSYSTILAYENDKFSARLAYTWREDFLHHNESAQFANPLGVYNDSESSLDLNLTYNVTDNFALTFDAVNLTNEKGQSYYTYEETNPFGTWLISRSFALGARYSF